MARYVYTTSVFDPGGFIEAGTVVEVLVQPEHTVPAADFNDLPAVVDAPHGAGFVLRDENGKLVPQGKATRLDGRSPHEPRY